MELKKKKKMMMMMMVIIIIIIITTIITRYPGRQAQNYLFKNINYINLYYIILHFPITIRMALTHLCYDDSEGVLVYRNTPAIKVQNVMKT
jgi:hypothetical protein